MSQDERNLSKRGEVEESSCDEFEEQHLDRLDAFASGVLKSSGCDVFVLDEAGHWIYRRATSGYHKAIRSPSAYPTMFCRLRIALAGRCG